MTILYLLVYTEAHGSSLGQLLFQGMVFDFEAPKLQTFGNHVM